jgi:hypothetical protein
MAVALLDPLPQVLSDGDLQRHAAHPAAASRRLDQSRVSDVIGDLRAVQRCAARAMIDL